MLLEKVRVVLNDIKEEGLENVFKRHNHLARATRTTVQAISLSMVAPDKPTDSAQAYLYSVAWMEENWLKACVMILVSL